VIAVLGGLGAALAFAGATLCNSRSVRMIDPWSLLGWIMLVGLLIVAPAVAVGGAPDALDGGAVGWLGIAGTGNVAGLLAAYAALRVGKVGIVAPVISTEGAIAAVVAVAAGEQLARGVGPVLAAIAAGIFLAGMSPEREEAAERDDRRALALAIVAALCFGASLYATGRAADELPVDWTLLPSRVLGVVAIAVPLAVMGRLRLTRSAVPFILASGVFEVAGFAFFAVGSREGIAVTAVLAAQFGAIAAIAAFVLFRERLTTVQVAGVALIVAGVTAVAWLQS
jgi:drug/metabolite transporter (DMT)-like permease